MKRIVSLVAVLAVAAADRLRGRRLAGSSIATGDDDEGHRQGLQVRALTKSAPHGKVTFKVTNKGQLKHDFKIAGKKTKLLAGQERVPHGHAQEGQEVHLHLHRARPCPAAGMKGTFKAT